MLTRDYSIIVPFYAVSQYSFGEGGGDENVCSTFAKDYNHIPNNPIRSMKIGRLQGRTPGES